MENKVSSEIVRGHINTIILSALVEGDKYGYEIRKEIEAKSQGSFVLKEPTLYSSLKRLEKQGFVEAYYGDDETHGGRRKYYKLTEYGRDVTLKNLNEWKYSRSLMDKLITEEKVDLQNTPPPENLDLNITKKVSKNYIDTKTKKSKDNGEPEPGEETKFVFNTSSDLPVKTKSRDPIIQLQQNMFEPSEEEEKASKEYKGLMEKLISTTKTHTANLEHVKAVEVEKVSAEDVKEEKVSYSLLPKADESGFFKARQEQIKSEGFKIRPFNSEKSKSYKQLLYINKLLFWTAILTFAAMMLEMLIVYLVFEKQISLGYKPYLITAACLLVIPAAASILCIIDRDKKIKAKLNLNALIITSLLIFAFGFLIILALALISRISAGNTKEIVIEVVFPVLLVFNVLTSTFFYALLYRSKKFHI